VGGGGALDPVRYPLETDSASFSPSSSAAAESKPPETPNTARAVTVRTRPPPTNDWAVVGRGHGMFRKAMTSSVGSRCPPRYLESDS